MVSKKGAKSTNKYRYIANTGIGQADPLAVCASCGHQIEEFTVLEEIKTKERIRLCSNCYNTKPEYEAKKVVVEKVNFNGKEINVVMNAPQTNMVTSDFELVTFHH